jgi:acyl-CoA dehydrogenase
MILAIWEGTAHRQILDGLEVIERKQVHKLLFDGLKDLAPAKELLQLEAEVERHLKLPTDEKEAQAQAEAIFRRLAVFTADQLSQRHAP